MIGSEWLERPDLQSVHIDERGRSLTAAFTSQASQDEAVEFFVVFSGVADLVVREDFTASFTCEDETVEEVRTFRPGPL